jgi:PAS domain S-box-containing protein
MFKVYLNGRVFAGFGIMLGLLIWLIYYSYQNNQRIVSSSHWVAHTHEVLYHAQKLLAVATNLEAGQRGYSLTGNEEFLEPYYTAKTEIDDHLQSLIKLTSDNGVQQKRLIQLRSHLDSLVNFSARAIHVRKKTLSSSLEINSSLNGKKYLDHVRTLISEFELHERSLLKERESSNDTQIQRFNSSFSVLIVLSVMLLLGVFFAVNDNLQARIESEKRLKKSAVEIQDLYDNAPCGYHSVDRDGFVVDVNNTLVKWLGYNTKQDIIGKLKVTDIIVEEDVRVFQQHFPVLREKGMINDLEFRFKRINGSQFPVILSSTAVTDDAGNFIKSRSITIDNTIRKRAEEQVKNVNQELEAFTYSVSHDLRAPLRSIDGYARVLQEDFYDKLDDEGKRVIKVIMNNAKRMGQLIDDLLDFARLGRKDVVKTNLDMTSMVKSIAEEAVRDESQRKIDVVVHSLHPSLVDIDMIRQVWINLISNAVKYTGRNANARIEISSSQTKDEVIYKVQDNGVGFDMQYSDKLFGVFQRLHKMQDFSGTGVGLAIVKRIVSRHEGRVWGEGKLDSGATFYFTIPLHGK